MKKALFILLALVLVFAISCEPEHEHKFEEKVVDPTCTTEGKKYKVCSCGAKSDEVTIPPTGHSEDLDKVVGAEATEEKEGYYNYICPICGDVVKTEKIDKLPAGGSGSGEPEHVHKYVEKEEPATCTTAGKTYKVCSCGEKIDEVTTPAKGHSEDLTLEVGEPPTEEKAGHYNYVCPVCKEVVKTEDIEKLLPRTIFVPKNADFKELDDTTYAGIKEWVDGIEKNAENTPTITYYTKLNNAEFVEDASYTFPPYSEFEDFRNHSVSFSGSGSVYSEIVENGTTTVKITGTINTEDTFFGKVNGEYTNAVITVNNGEISINPENSIILTDDKEKPITGERKMSYLGMVLQAFSDYNILEILKCSGYYINEDKESNATSYSIVSFVHVFDNEEETEETYVVCRAADNEKVLDMLYTIGYGEEPPVFKYMKDGDVFYDPVSVNQIVFGS